MMGSLMDVAMIVGVLITIIIGLFGFIGVLFRGSIRTLYDKHDQLISEMSKTNSSLASLATTLKHVMENELPLIKERINTLEKKD